MELTNELKSAIAKALLEGRKSFGGSDADYATKFNLSPSVYSRLKGGDYKDTISVNKWIEMAMYFGISEDDTTWHVVETDVMYFLRGVAMTCQNESVAMMIVDECGIGKTFCAKYLCRKELVNAFYIDCSQCKTRGSFIKEMARAVGADVKGNINDIKMSLKVALKGLRNPLIVLDEAGDLDGKAFLELKELWNATENECGWIAMGAEGLEHKWKLGVEYGKVGYREVLSRYGDAFMKVVPTDRKTREEFYSKLLRDVLQKNCPTQYRDAIYKRAMAATTSETTGLRRVKTLLSAMKEKDNNQAQTE